MKRLGGGSRFGVAEQPMPERYRTGIAVMGAGNAGDRDRSDKKWFEKCGKLA
jgi:hypothetical protein